MSDFNKLYLYEQQGQFLIAVNNILATEANSDKFAIINNFNESLEITKNRLYELPDLNSSIEQEKIGEILNSLFSDARNKIQEFNPEELWNKYKNTEKIIVADLCKKLDLEVNTLNYLSLFLALVDGRLYFKRTKDSFYPRDSESIENLKRQNEVSKKKEAEIKICLDYIKEKVSTGQEIALPTEIINSNPIYNLCCFAAEAKHLDPIDRKDTLKFLNELKSLVNIPVENSPEKVTVSILKKLGVFNHNSHLIYFHNNLKDDFSKKSLREIDELKVNFSKVVDSNNKRKDLTNLECFTIDSESTLDMDDAISLEKTTTGFSLGIHISDLDCIIPHNSSLDKDAKIKATSIYTPDYIFNMFPTDIANNLGSLVVGEIRPTLSILINVDREFNLLDHKILLSKIKVSKKYSYNEVETLIENEDPFFLNLYQIIAQHEAQRIMKGATQAQKKVPEIILDQNGEPSLEIIDESSFSRNMIAELMIIANKFFAEFARNNFIPAIFRCQDKGDESRNIHSDSMTFMPSYASSTAKPHYALGLNAYLQATSPIRRYADLCNQRQIISFLTTKKPFYERKNLENVSKNLRAGLQIGMQVSKDTKRFWLLKYLEKTHKIGDVLDAIVVRAEKNKVLVSLNQTSLTAILKTDKTFKLNQEIQVKLSQIDPICGSLKVEV